MESYPNLQPSTFQNTEDWLFSMVKATSTTLWNRTDMNDRLLILIYILYTITMVSWGIVPIAKGSANTQSGFATRCFSRRSHHHHERDMDETHSVVSQRNFDRSMVLLGSTAFNFVNLWIIQISCVDNLLGIIQISIDATWAGLAQQSRGLLASRTCGHDWFMNPRKKQPTLKRKDKERNLT